MIVRTRSTPRTHPKGERNRGNFEQIRGEYPPDMFKSGCRLLSIVKESTIVYWNP